MKIRHPHLLKTSIGYFNRWNGSCCNQIGDPNRPLVFSVKLHLRWDMKLKVAPLIARVWSWVLVRFEVFYLLHFISFFLFIGSYILCFSIIFLNKNFVAIYLKIFKGLILNFVLLSQFSSQLNQITTRNWIV